MAALTGRWRIFEMELWDTDYLDLVEPAYIRFYGRGHGEFVFGTVTGGLDCRHSSDRVDFTWQGNDEMDEASGSGWAKRNKDGTINGEIQIHLGDKSGFKARKF